MTESRYDYQKEADWYETKVATKTQEIDDLREENQILREEIASLKRNVSLLESFFDPNHMGLTHLKLKRYFEAKEERGQND